MTALVVQNISIDLPEKLRFLLEMHRYKVAYGGRGGAKSWAFANALLGLAVAQPLRILCAREYQNSIDESVYQLLCNRIEALGLGSYYHVAKTEIVSGNGSEFIFSGLAEHTADSIKSYEGIDVVWVEEAHTVSKKSWDILIPTIRAENSEIWVSFNPELETDEAWRRFVANKPPGARVVKMTWRDNPWFPQVLEDERQYMQRTAPDDYENIWEGNPRQVVAGAIYAREISQMMAEGRIRPIPYDPRLPVHTIWDLGWNDAMAIIMVQKPVPTVLNVVNYLEDRHRSYAEYVTELDKLGYRWGTDWLPHDGANKNPQTKMSAQDTLRQLKRRSVKIIGGGRPMPVEEGIRAARMMFPRVYMDDGERRVATGYLGAKRLAECLKRYRRNVPQTTGEPGTPVHDEFSHGADAYRGLALIVDQITNEDQFANAPTMPAYQPSVPGMGMLG